MTWGQLEDWFYWGPVIVKEVVAFLLFSQAVFRMACGSLLGAAIGLRCTPAIGRQLRVEPDQRFGLAWRAMAQTTSRFFSNDLSRPE